MKTRCVPFVAPVILCVLLGGCGAKPPPRDFFKENVDRWKGEVSRWGGNWEAWEAAVAPFHEDVKGALAARPEEIQGIVGRDGFLFYRRSLDVLVAGDLRAQMDGRDPYPAVVDFYEQLKGRGVDLLFCAVPVKAAAMPEKLSERAPGTDGPYVNPNTRRLMLQLAEAGVECVDLLPHFLALRKEAGAEPVYMPQDTHWMPGTVPVAARVFAERIRAYPWYAEAAEAAVSYSVRTAPFKRRGDIVHMLPESEKLRYPPMKLQGEQVLNPDDSFYEDDESSPILLLGDSYAGVFHFEDCQNAGITAHLAKELGFPIDLILGQGMGPKVRGKWVRNRRENALKGKKLVIWMLSERDLYNYRAPWDIILIPPARPKPLRRGEGP